MTTTKAWQKSSSCGEGDACVHVSATPDGHVRLMESEDPTGSILTTTPARFRALLDALRTGSPAPAGGIEVAYEADGVVRLRDADGGADAVVTTTREKWDAFTQGAREGEFDHLAPTPSPVR